jgi:hypothetical protein
MNRELPQVLRVKRKRTDDPLQALVMETSRRQIKRPRYVFRLKRTEEKDIQDSTAVLTANKDLKNNKPVFNIPSSRKSISNDSTFGTDSNNNNNSTCSSYTKTSSTASADKELQTQNLTGQTYEEGPVELKPELLEMLNDYLKDNDETTINNHVKPPKRRQSSVSQDSNNLPHFSKEQTYLNSNNPAINEAVIEEEQDNDSEYVYDVYYRDKAISEQWENEHIGYIKFDDDELDKFLDDENDNLLINTDDEDSNDENFYRNDYPEDEDAGYDNESDLVSLGLDEPSDDQDDEFDIINDKRRFSKLDFLRNEGLKSMSDDEYQNLSAQIDEKPILWGRSEDGRDLDMDDTNIDETNIDDAMDDVMDDDIDDDIDDETESFQRQEFFKSDRDDPMAIHRDQIFGKLQRMIERQQQ